MPRCQMQILRKNPPRAMLKQVQQVQQVQPLLILWTLRHFQTLDCKHGLLSRRLLRNVRLFRYAHHTLQRRNSVSTNKAMAGSTVLVSSRTTTKRTNCPITNQVLLRGFHHWKLASCSLEEAGARGLIAIYYWKSGGSISRPLLMCNELCTIVLSNQTPEFKPLQLSQIARPNLSLLSAACALEPLL